MSWFPGELLGAVGSENPPKLSHHQLSAWGAIEIRARGSGSMRGIKIVEHCV